MMVNPRMRGKMLLPFVMMLLVTAIQTTAAELPAAFQQRMDEVIEHGMKCRNIPGLAVGIVKDGQVLVTKGYGVRSPDTHEPVTPDTLFGIASLTKAFTSALLANILSADPSRSLSTNVYHIFDKGSMFNDSLRSTYATIEDLLAHRVGIPENNYIRLSTDITRHNLAERLQYLPKEGGFRDSFFYNNLMYTLAAVITERLGGRPWEDMVKENIFTPLGMNRSTFVTQVDFSDNVAIPMCSESGLGMVKCSLDFIRHWGSFIGSGNMLSSAREMAQWLLCLLNDGSAAGGRRVLVHGLTDILLKPHNTIPLSTYARRYMRPATPQTFSGDTYALGWRLGYYRGYRTAHHSGSTFGYNSYITLLRDENIGIFSTATGDDNNFEFRTALHTFLADLAMGFSPWINSSTICTFPDPWKSSSARAKRNSPTEPLIHNFQYAGNDIIEKSHPIRRKYTSTEQVVARAASLPLASYVGVFGHGAYGELRVQLNTEVSQLELTYGIGHWRLQASVGNRFQGRWLKDPPILNMTFEFLVGSDDVYGVKAPGFESPVVPIFYRKSEAAVIG